MTTEEFLKQATTIDMEIKAIREMIDEEIDAVSRIKGLDYSRERLQGGQVKDITDKLVEVFDSTEKDKLKILELARLKVEIRELIGELANGVERTIMYRKFILGQSNEKIAEAINAKSTKTVKRYYDRALKRLECKLKRLNKI